MTSVKDDAPLRGDDFGQLITRFRRHFKCQPRFSDFGTHDARKIRRHSEMTVIAAQIS